MVSSGEGPVPCSHAAAFSPYPLTSTENALFTDSNPLVRATPACPHLTHRFPFLKSSRRLPFQLGISGIHVSVRGRRIQGQKLCASWVLSGSNVDVGDWGVTPVMGGDVVTFSGLLRNRSWKAMALS